MSTLMRDTQPWNADAPTDSTPSGMTAPVSDPILENAPWAIYVILPGMVILFRDLEPANKTPIISVATSDRQV
jgi:hypothetical protein